MSTAEEDWIKALTFAALPGAAHVVLERKKTSDGVSYRLSSFDDADTPIGDDRDYDMLKAAMGPLERLAEREGDAPLRIRLDLAGRRLTRA